MLLSITKIIFVKLNGFGIEILLTFKTVIEYKAPIKIQMIPK